MLNNPYIISSITTHLAFNTLLSLYGKDEIEKKNSLVERLQYIIDSEYNSQFSRYDTIVNNAIFKKHGGFIDIVTIPIDKEKDFEKYIYLNVLYKTLHCRAIEEKINNQNISNTNLYEDFARKVYEQIELITFDYDINTIQNLLNAYEKKNMKEYNIKKRSPIWINWLIMGTIATGLFFGGIYFLDKNTKLFLTIKKR